MHTENIRNSSPLLFDAIAGTYDRINRLLSCGVDKLWRRALSKKVPKTPFILLDLATGTGDQLFSLLERTSEAYGVDPSQGMLEIAKEKGKGKKATFLLGDALSIPLADASIHCVTMSFGIRNISDRKGAFTEMLRVLKPGGVALILEFSLPSSKALRFPYLFYLRHILPRIGKLFSKHPYAYSYLRDTIEIFPYGKAFAGELEESGFKKVSWKSLTGGIVTLYEGYKL